jgi:tRNA (guanine-N7-)-methyltransferase
MADHEITDVPPSPDEMDWHKHYPQYFSEALSSDEKNRESTTEVSIADIGCGFGGLSVKLAAMFPEKLILGLEIRPRVVDSVRSRIVKLRATATQLTHATQQNGSYQNVSVMRINIMKQAPNVFRKGQLEMMFFLFPDPHFKKANHRRRVINPNFLAIYAYILRVGGLLYTITDVEELHDWMVKHLSEHPLFERAHDKEAKDCPVIDAIHNSSEEGQKVSRHSGRKFPAVFRRIDSRSAHAELTQDAP